MNVNSVSTQPDETVVYDGRTSDGSQLAEKRTEVGRSVDTVDTLGFKPPFTLRSFQNFA